VRTPDPALYFHGVARNVLKEYWRKPERKSSSLEAILPSQQPGEDPSAVEEEASAQQTQERQYQCLNRCVQNLSPEYQELIVQYYYAQGRTKIQNRNRLAEELKITVNALRIRAHRIREDLEGCVAACLKQLQAS
jgi:RNA polymerase sigma factor (sigma-70 family)